MGLMDLRDFSMNELIKAGDIWYARKQKLIRAWCNGNAFEKRRISKLIDVLEMRFNEAYQRHTYKKQLLEKQQREFDHQFILLYCYNFECKEGIGIMMKDYKPGEHLCPTCNRVLRSDYDDKLDDMLFEIGLHTT
jgi:hypothetical protein